MMKIAIVDDHPMVRAGIRLTISNEEDMEVIGEAGTSREALALLSRISADVLVLDINLPDRSGLDTLRDIVKTQPELPVLILSIHPEGSVAIRAIKSGASGFLNKESAPSELVLALRKLHKGGTYISEGLADLLVKDVGGRSAAILHDALSDREYQVMCLLASGQSIAQIASLLHRSPNTISTFRARILEKMGMSTNADLTRYALQNQLIAGG